MSDSVLRTATLDQPAPPQPPAAAITLHTARIPNDDEIRVMYERLAAVIPESSSHANDRLLQHLTTIVSNLLIFPYTDPRFRRLRVGNRKLQEELFSHPSALPCLRMIGFRESVDELGDEKCLVVPLSTADHLTLLRAVKIALSRIAERDQMAVEASARFASFRRSVAFERRMERLQQELEQAPEKGDEKLLDEYIVTHLCWNDCDMGPKVVAALRTITRNILIEPHTERYRHLRLSSAILRDVVFPAQGSVEYLVGLLKFEWNDNGLSLAMDATDTAVAAYTARAERGLALLNTADEALEAKRQAENAMRRTAALEEREAEKRRLVSQQQHARSENVPSSSSTGKRIPIGEALKIIMGTNRQDSDKS